MMFTQKNSKRVNTHDGGARERKSIFPVHACIGEDEEELYMPLCSKMSLLYLGSSVKIMKLYVMNCLSRCY